MVTQLGINLVRSFNKLSFYVFKGFYFICSLSSKAFRIQKYNLKKSLDTIILDGIKYDDRLINATICIEDKRFYFHFGHDIFSIFRAVLNNLTKRRIQGASTIEQQIIRLILGRKEITLKRKLFEIILSTQFNQYYTKEEIINIYLSSYIYSNGIIGVNSLCKVENYELEKLSNNDIFEIAARFKYPNLSQKNYLKFLKRVRLIEKLYTKANYENLGYC